MFFPAEKPTYSYLDIVSYNWEHDGMQGFGVGGAPHGHLALEFGDDMGNFYSVGQYMDPQATINTKTKLAATVRAVLMTPDPYMASKGEKTMHRYHLGNGKEGRETIKLLKKYIEENQGWSKDPETGIVSIRKNRRYHTFENNCGAFATEIEAYAKKNLGAKLVKIGDDEVLVPTRLKTSFKKNNWFKELASKAWNLGLLTFVDMVIWIALHLPWVSTKIGVGAVDETLEKLEIPTEGEVKKGVFGFTWFALKNFKSLLRSAKPRRVLFPRRVRYEQMYGRKLKGYSVRLLSPQAK